MTVEHKDTVLYLLYTAFIWSGNFFFALQPYWRVFVLLFCTFKHYIYKANTKQDIYFKDVILALSEAFLGHKRNV